MNRQERQAAFAAVADLSFPPQGLEARASQRNWLPGVIGARAGAPGKVATRLRENLAVIWPPPGGQEAGVSGRLVRMAAEEALLTTFSVNGQRKEFLEPLQARHWRPNVRSSEGPFSVLDLVTEATLAKLRAADLEREARRAATLALNASLEAATQIAAGEKPDYAIFPYHRQSVFSARNLAAAAVIGWSLLSPWGAGGCAPQAAPPPEAAFSSSSWEFVQRTDVGDLYRNPFTGEYARVSGTRSAEMVTLDIETMQKRLRAVGFSEEQIGQLVYPVEVEGMSGFAMKDFGATAFDLASEGYQLSPSFFRQIWLDVQAMNQNGVIVRSGFDLDDLAIALREGRPVIVYLDPTNLTPGMTELIEAGDAYWLEEMRKNVERLAELHGVSWEQIEAAGALSLDDLAGFEDLLGRPLEPVVFGSGLTLAELSDLPFDEQMSQLKTMVVQASDEAGVRQAMTLSQELVGEMGAAEEIVAGLDWLGNQLNPYEGVDLATLSQVERNTVLLYRQMFAGLRDRLMVADKSEWLFQSYREFMDFQQFGQIVDQPGLWDDLARQMTEAIPAGCTSHDEALGIARPIVDEWLKRQGIGAEGAGMAPALLDGAETGQVDDLAGQIAARVARLEAAAPDEMLFIPGQSLTTSVGDDILSALGLPELIVFKQAGVQIFKAFNLWGYVELARAVDHWIDQNVFLKSGFVIIGGEPWHWWFESDQSVRIEGQFHFEIHQGYQRDGLNPYLAEQKVTWNVRASRLREACAGLITAWYEAVSNGTANDEGSIFQNVTARSQLWNKLLLGFNDPTLMRRAVFPTTLVFQPATNQFNESDPNQRLVILDVASGQFLVTGTGGKMEFLAFGQDGVVYLMEAETSDDEQMNVFIRPLGYSHLPQ